jgi:hypothetical protein
MNTNAVARLPRMATKLAMTTYFMVAIIRLACARPDTHGGRWGFWSAGAGVDADAHEKAITARFVHG